MLWWFLYTLFLTSQKQLLPVGKWALASDVCAFLFAVLIYVQEIFGPVMTCYVYPDNKADDVLDLVSSAVASTDRMQNC